MSLQQIIPLEGAAVLPLSPEVLTALGINIGDVVDLSVIGRQLLVQPTDEGKRHEQFKKIVTDLFERRRSAYEQLAKGPS